jgi:putative phage-type endonuclease
MGVRRLRRDGGGVVNAIPLSNFTPGSPEWQKRMTASKVAAVLGLSPWESRFSLWHRMAGLIPPQDETDQTRRGHYLEDAVAQWFADQPREFGQFRLDPGGAWAHPERPWQAASPDRLVSGLCGHADGDCVIWHPRAVLEVKTAADMDEWGPAGSDEIPPYYRAQVMWQLDTLGLPVAYVAVLLPRLEFREYRIDYNAAEAEYIRAEARAFLDSLPGGPAEQRPNLDGHAETYAAVRTLHPDIDPRDEEVPVELAREFCDASNALKAAKAREAAARVRLADHMGTAQTAVFIDGDTRIKLADRRAKGDGIPYVQAASRLPEIGSAA